MNKLETEKISKLLYKFTIPSVVSLLVNALYNLVDQIFIGNYVGYIGNTATTIAFPLITISLAITLVIGNGGASYYSLKLGEKKYEKSKKIVYYVITMLIFVSILYYFITNVFLESLLYIFGATNETISITLDYTRIILIGMPFTIFSTGFSSLVRADGSPKFAMIAMIFGAIINVFLDKIFIVNYSMGVKGAAFATIIGQIFVFLIYMYYLFNFKNVKLKISEYIKSIFLFDFKLYYKIISLGISSFITQIGITFVQITLNNVVKIYGGNSIYGSEIPIAAFGIATKVSTILISIIVGIGIGSQPILGYNYGAKKYDRVLKTYLTEIKISTIIAIIGSLIFLIFPKQIIYLFGKEKSENYINFAVNCFRIYLAASFFIGFQINSSMFFQAIGKPLRSSLLTMSRQVVLLIPFLIIFPRLFGINGVFFAGPVADVLSAMITYYFIRNEINKLKKERNNV